eukprot:5607-Heterococcus_DN1.PRE.1
MLCERGCCAKLLVGKDIETAASVTFDLPTFATDCPNPHFFEELTTQPDITLGCLGLGLCLVRHQARPDLLLVGQKIIPRFVNSAHATDIGQLKSLLVNKFVTVVGNVVRASGITVIVTGAEFSCPKCGAVMHRRFEEGKYNPPTRCLGSNCKVIRNCSIRNCSHLAVAIISSANDSSYDLARDARCLLPAQARSFDLLRDTAATEDFQKLRLQEIEGDKSEPGRIPRTLE